MTRQQIIAPMLLVALGTALVLSKPHCNRMDYPATVDTLAVIEGILQQDGADPRLMDRWPGAAVTMLRMSRVFDLDPYLLPCIARMENPHPKYLNPYGLTWHGRIRQYESYTYATYRAAELLAKLKPIYQGERGPSIPALASAWCPLEAERWTRAMTAIYQQAIK